MKICLIEPPKLISITNAASTCAMPPLGLAYIAASLRNSGHDVTLVDGVGPGLFDPYYAFQESKRIYVKGLTIPKILDRVPKGMDLIGFACMFTPQWLVMREIIREVKRCHPKAILILGGEHVTGFTEGSFQQSPIDIAVLGEGEETAVELCQKLQTKEPYDSVLGIAFRTNTGSVKINPRRSRISHIDNIPPPAWDLVDLEKYMRFNQPHGASQGRFMPMLATRGCPYECTFCTSPQMWTRKWVARTPKLVVDEMELYMKEYGATDFQFEDLTAIVRKDWIIEFCDEIIKRNLKITFQLPSGTRSEAVDYEVATKMKAAGCHYFNFAPESGDERILKLIKKKVQLKRMFTSARHAMKAGINVGCFFIIGFPEDTIGSIFRTYGAIIKCAIWGFEHINLSAYTPQPNTESFRQLRAAGKLAEISDDYMVSVFDFIDYGAVRRSHNDRFSDRQLTLLISLGVALFYTFDFLSKPYRLITLIRDIFKSRAVNRTNQVARTFFREFARIRRAKSVQKAASQENKETVAVSKTF